MDTKNEIPQLKISTGWIAVEIIDEPLVVNTYKGYAPYLLAKTLINGLEYKLFISAKSLSDQLEILTKENNMKFSGLKFKIKKEGEERTSKFQIEKM